MSTILGAEKLTFSQAARKIPCHVSTVWRWALSGVGGRKLPSIMIGGRRYVLLKDLEKFLSEGRQAAERPREDFDGRESAEKAAEDLESLGI